MRKRARLIVDELLCAGERELLVARAHETLHQEVGPPGAQFGIFGRRDGLEFRARLFVARPVQESLTAVERVGERQRDVREAMLLALGDRIGRVFHEELAPKARAIAGRRERTKTGEVTRRSARELLGALEITFGNRDVEAERTADIARRAARELERAFVVGGAKGRARRETHQLWFDELELFGGSFERDARGLRDTLVEQAPTARDLDAARLSGRLEVAWGARQERDEEKRAKAQ